jgi:hypothetical protein
LSKITVNTPASDIEAMLGVTDSKKSAAEIFIPMLGHVPASETGKEYWIYRTPYGDLQIVMQNGYVASVSNLESILEKIEATRREEEERKAPSISPQRGGQSGQTGKSGQLEVSTSDSDPLTSQRFTPENLSKIMVNTPASDIEAVLGVTDSKKSADEIFIPMLGHVPASETGKEYWIYHTPYGDLQIVMQNGYVASVSNLESILEKIEATRRKIDAMRREEVARNENNQSAPSIPPSSSISPQWEAPSVSSQEEAPSVSSQEEAPSVSPQGGGQTTSVIPPKEDRKQERVYYERDNRGMRVETIDQSINYWLGERMQNTRKDPFVYYVFSNESDARKAMLELPFIHTAQDSGKLICDDVFRFGYFAVTSNGAFTGDYDAFVAGADFTHDMWEKTHAAFAKHNGKKRSDLEPVITPAVTEQALSEQASNARSETASVSPPVSPVTYIGEKIDKECTWVEYRGANKAAAMDFLAAHPVNKPYYYIVVETPEGVFGRDIDGFYQE